MASNELPRNPAALFTLADDMVDGLADHETEVGVRQNTAAAVSADLAAARAAQDAFQTVRGGKPKLSAAVTVADSNAKAFLGNASTVLRRFLGEPWNQQWLATGFPHQSTGVPRLVGERESLLGELRTYFTGARQRVSL